jgi:Amt family ammonium transporter
VRSRGDSGALEYRVVPRLFGGDGHWIAPEAWLPVASRSGLTRELRRWIIARAVSLLAERAVATLRFTVHLSASSVEDETLVQFIAGQIAAEGIEPSWLAFEIDLRSVLAAPAKADAMARAIRALGCRMIVSGFDGGSGTLAMLRTLPVDAVKLAPALVRDAAADAGHRAVAEAIRELAATFGRDVIAEGVDTRALHVAMRDLGIGGFQGEAIASTIPIDVAMWPKRETLVDQPVPDRVVRDLGVGPQVELFQQARAVHAHGLRA